MAHKATASNLDQGRVEFRRPPLTVPEKAHHVTRYAKSLIMNDETGAMKVNSRNVPHSQQGQKHLLAGDVLSLQLWEEEHPGRRRVKTKRDAETIGYVIAGRAELLVGERQVLLKPGDAWIVPKGVLHQYRILTPFTAIEVSCPPLSAQPPQGQES